MQYFKMIRNKIQKFCADRDVAAGNEINFLQKSDSKQCKEILAIYEKASEVMEEDYDVAEINAQLSNLYDELLKIA